MGTRLISRVGSVIVGSMSEMIQTDATTIKPKKRKAPAKKAAPPKRKAKQVKAKAKPKAKAKGGKSGHPAAASSLVIWVYPNQKKYIQAIAKKKGIAVAEHLRRSLKLPPAKH